MKKLLLILALLFATESYADSSFLSCFDFEYMYPKDSENYIFFQDVFKNGIEQNTYMDFLLSDTRTFGEKVTLISTLSGYFEFKYESDEEVSGDYIPPGYFNEYTKAFANTVCQKYQVETINDKKVPNELKYLYHFMGDFGIFKPDIEKYNKLTKLMPNSLTAQSVKVITFAYFIIYNDKSFLKDDYYKNYFNPYKANWESYNEDILPKVAKKVEEWNNYLP